MSIDLSEILETAAERRWNGSMSTVAEAGAWTDLDAGQRTIFKQRMLPEVHLIADLTERAVREKIAVDIAVLDNGFDLLTRSDVLKVVAG